MRGGFLTYDGEPVVTRLEADGLRKLAAATPGGRYVNVATGNFDLGPNKCPVTVAHH